MSRYRPERQPTGIFRGGELPRLMTGIVMLAVLYMLYSWARQASTWGWLVADGNKAARTGQAAGPRPKKPAPVEPASGPTDEDPDQAEMAGEEFQAITDGSLTLGPEEMEAYDRLVEWVKNQSFARLDQRAKKGLRYTHLHDDAERRRGELVALNLEIRMAGDAGENRYGVPLYDAWGVTDESRGRLYALIVVDYPKGMPVGVSIREKAKFAGYFLKLQGYVPGEAKPGAAPEKAPLLIGRLEWEPVVAPPTDNTQEWTWGLIALALVGLVIAARFVYHRVVRRRSAARSAVPEARPGEVIPIDVWLDRSGFTSDEESDAGEAEAHLPGDERPDGSPERAAPRFPDGLDGGGGKGR
jgi:hypothetical protein